MFEANSREREILYRSDVNLLILGETGTGKSTLAKQIHEQSSRNRGPYIALNVCSVHANTFESELYGHVRGAFTGAHQSRQGRMNLADGGTLFLDEIGELSLEQQSRLLEFIQDRKVIPIGANVGHELNVRLICATHRSLDEDVKTGRFRADLLYRLRGYEIALSPLRQLDLDRQIHDVLERLLKKHQRVGVLGLSEALAELLEMYPWPGNFRELEAVLEGMVLLSGRDSQLGLEHLPHWFSRLIRDVVAHSSEPDAPVEHQVVTNGGNFRDAFHAFLSSYIPNLLARHGGSFRNAAEHSGLSLPTLRKYYRVCQKLSPPEPCQPKPKLDA